MLARVAETLFPVRPAERRLTGVLFLHSLFAVGAFLSGRAVRDALFLTHRDPRELAWMYVASAVAVAGVGTFYSPLAARVRRDRMAAGSSLLFAVLYALAWAVDQTGRTWLYAALYVYVEVMGALCLLQFWTLANELFNAREAKRLYGLIGSGGTLANIFVGLTISRVALRYGASALLWVCVALCLGCAGAAWAAGQVGRQRMFARAAQGRVPSIRRALGATRVLTSGHLRAVALLAAVTFFTITIVDYQFKVIAKESFPVGELAAYFGRFNVVIGLLAIGLQLFGTNSLLSRVGVIGSLAVLPLSVLFGTSVLAFFPGLWAASLAKGADSLFRYSVNDATTQILYLPVASHSRASAKAFIDGVVKPVAIGLSGLFLLGHSRWLQLPTGSLAPIGILLGICWTLVVLSLRSQYLRSLQDTLKNRRLELASVRHRVQDGSTQGVVLRALESGDPREVLSALELLPYLENLGLDHRVEALLEHPLPAIRVSALSYYSRRQTLRFANSIFRRFEDEDAGVRAAAVTAFCAIGRDKSVRSVSAFLGDPDPAIRSAAITGMIRYGGLDGVLAAAEALKALIGHEEPVMREHAAKVLGAVGVRNFYQPVLELMNDPAPPVRRAAVLAAGQLKSPELTLPLIYKLQGADTWREAIQALSELGAPTVGALARVLGNHLEDARMRRGVARVLGRMGPPAAPVLLEHLGETDEELRTRVFRALTRVSKGTRLSAPERSAVRAALQTELTHAFLAIAAAELLRLTKLPSSDTPRRGPAAAAALLTSALADKVAQAERRVFLLLAVLFPEADMESIAAGLRDATALDAGRRRANAVELLDNLLDRELKRMLLPLIEDAPRAERLRQVVPLLTRPLPSTASEMVRELCRDENGWVRSCALLYASEHGLPLPEETFAAAAADPHPVVRETALVCLLRSFPERAHREAEAHLVDETPVVRQRAALISQRRQQLTS